MILVVDDDDDLRAVLSDALTAAGYEVRTAANGREALDALRAEPGIRLVLLDLMMPVMNGWEVRAAQLADPALAATPTIVLTAAADLGRTPVQADAVLKKPLTTKRLLNEVAERLAG